MEKPQKRRRLLYLAAVALVSIALGAFAVPRLWRSGFVAQRRAAFHLRRGKADLAAGRIDAARTEFRTASKLKPGDAEARRELAALELSQDKWELAYLELQSLTEMHPEDPEAWLGLADLMMKSGWLEAPEAALDQAIEAAPERADAHERRGGIRFKLGRYFGAREDARIAVAGSPKDAKAWALLLRSTARAEGTEAGIEAARRGVAAAGRDRELLLPLARLLDKAGQTREALAIVAELGAAKNEAELEQALGPPPAPPRRLRADAQTDLGRLGAWTREHWPGRLAKAREELEDRLQEKKWPEAQRIVDEAARSWPQSSFAPFLAGTLALARGLTDDAELRFTEALAVAPRFPTALAALARAWAAQKGAYHAGNQLVALAERDPGLSSARYMAARAYVEARDPIKAESALRRGLQLQPGSPVPYQQLTDYYFGLDRSAEALAICQEGIARFPQSVDLQLMLAQMLASQGAAADAVRLYDGLLAARPDLDLARYKLAVLLASQDDPAMRERFLQLARELRNDDPSDPLLDDALGWVQLKAGNTARAGELLAKAVQGAPEEPSLHFHLAALHAARGKTDLSRAELKLALDSPRPFAERLEAMRLLRESAPAPSGRATARH